MLLLFLVVSMLDVLGIGMIGPFIALIGHEGNIVDNYPIFLSILGVVDNRTVIASIGVLLVTIFCLKSIMAFFVQKKILSLGYEIRASLIDNLVKSYQSMGYEDVVTKDTSAMIVSTNTHVGLFIDSVFVPALRMAIEFLVIIGIIILMSFTSLLTVIALSTMLSLVLIVYFKYIKVRLYQYGKVMSDKEIAVISEIKHVIGAFREIRLLGVETFFRDEIKANVIQFGEAGVITRSLHLISRYLVETSMVIFIVIFVIYMLNQSESTTQIFSTLSVFAVAAVRLVPSISQIGLSVANIKTGMHALNSVHKELTSVKGVKEHVKRKNDEFSTVFNSLELKNISYSYDHTGDCMILNNVNLLINSGEFIGIFGKSGSGKSTLMDIMIGMLTPDQGDLIVNGIKCNDSYLEQWQSKCAYIPQDVFLINASIKNNIALGVNESEIDYGKLHLAIKAAQLEEVVMQDKMGLDSCVGEEGARLSGGQKQRVALARALYAGREVIFLDEATSALDKTTEDKIISNILSLNNQMTIILITHNESALQDCNKVFHVSNGSVV